MPQGKRNALDNMAKAYEEITPASTNLVQLAEVATQQQQTADHREWGTRGHGFMVSNMVMV